MKNLFIILAIVKLICLSFEVHAAYEPNAISHMSCPNATLDISHMGGVCTMSVAADKASIWDTAYNYRPLMYNSSGLISQRPKLWFGTVTITDATQQSVNISSAGFSSVTGCAISVIDDTYTHVEVRSTSVTAIVLDSYQLATTGVTILGIPVLQTITAGAATNLTGLQVNLVVTGY